jgi:peroxiredoxin
VLSTADLSLLADRLLLAAVFLLAGATKLVDPVGTGRALRDFGLPSALARPMVLLLPALELLVAAALVPASSAWYGAWGALALLTVFVIAIGVAIGRGRKPNCHCFGQLDAAPVGWWTFVRNAVLAACAGWLASRGRGQSGPALWAWLVALDSHGRKVAVVFGLVAGFLFLRQVDRSRPLDESIESASPIDDEEEPEEAPAPVPRRRPAPAPTPYSAPARSAPMGIGLPIGTLAPEFELPGITGEKRSLQSLRAQGKDVLLIFSSPFCESCEALVSQLAGWMREMEGLPNIVLVNVGTAQDNLAKLKEFDASRILLQPNFDVAEMYDCGTTPTAVLVGADGLIRSLLATGGPAIKELLSSCAKRGDVPAPI